MFFLYPVRCTLYAENTHPTNELITAARQAIDQQNFDQAVAYARQCIEKHQEQAVLEQSSLRSFPSADEWQKYQALNDVGTSYFIQGEAYMKQGKREEAAVAFQAVIEQYSYSQWWDPRGWYVKAAEESQYKLEKLGAWSLEPEGEEKKKEQKTKDIPKLILFDYGKETLVDYSQYGEFKNIGTADYQYQIRDPKGLAKAVGEGIFPNSKSVLEDPEYQRLEEQKRLEGNHWDFINSDDISGAFYKWASVKNEERGVKLFYTAHLLEKAGLLEHAIKAYYAIVVHFPGAIGWTYWNTPWYVGAAAIDKISYLCRSHPELGLALEGAAIQVIGGFDDDVANDQFVTNPGRLIKVGQEEAAQRAKLAYHPQAVTQESEARQVRGNGKVRLIQSANGHWQMRVEDKPFLIKAVAYTPTKVGQSPDNGTLEDWSLADENKNGLNDAAYESWVDKNQNGVQDPDEPAVGDFQLLKELGANSIRIYHHGLVSNKELFRQMYEKYGLYIIMGDFLGAYTVGSGASWYEGTDYSNETQRQKMMQSVEKMVHEHKDEPYLLLWMLGNENNYGVANNAKKNPEAYYQFVNEAAKRIKELDPNHPVAICNGDVLYLDQFAKLCPEIDIYGANAYRGKHGFGSSFWSSVQYEADKPAMVTEYGAPAFAKGKSAEWAEKMQAEYHRGCWQDILANSTGNGVGNALGGVVFEWLDEWWKSYEPNEHDTKQNYTGPFPDGWMYEEWLGIVGQGNGLKSPFARELRPAYFEYQRMWKE
jgi:beta-glucuronidase